MCTAGKISIGIGRNLDDVGISPNESLILFTNDVDRVIMDLATFPWWERLNDARRVALADMRFQLGYAGFRKFTQMLKALDAGDYVAAAHAARASKWAREQTPLRAAKVTKQIETGEL
jgi:lysozyme